MRITLYPGQYSDAETGLYYNFHRYYDPKIGRYLRVDPIGFAGGDMNLYTYVDNEPIQYYDPLGLANYCGEWGDHLKLDGWAKFGALWGQVSANMGCASGYIMAGDMTGDLGLYEHVDKHNRYLFAKNVLITSSQWVAVLDDWYYETHNSNAAFISYGDPISIGALQKEWTQKFLPIDPARIPHFYYRGDDPRNQDIMNNPGFRVLLRCWIHYRRLAQEMGIPEEKLPSIIGSQLDPPKKFGNIWKRAFDWDFGANPGKCAGGWNAYWTPEVQLLGSYQAQIEELKSVPGPTNKYAITIIDSKGWASATRRPVFMRKLLNMGERQSVYLNEHRYEYPEHRGGMMVLHFEFEVEEDPCATCDLDFDLKQAIRQNYIP